MGSFFFFLDLLFFLASFSAFLASFLASFSAFLAAFFASFSSLAACLAAAFSASSAPFFFFLLLLLLLLSRGQRQPHPERIDCKERHGYHGRDSLPNTVCN